MSVLVQKYFFFIDSKKKQTTKMFKYKHSFILSFFFQMSSYYPYLVKHYKTLANLMEEADAFKLQGATFIYQEILAAFMTFLLLKETPSMKYIIIFCEGLRSQHMASQYAMELIEFLKKEPDFKDHPLMSAPLVQSSKSEIILENGLKIDFIPSTMFLRGINAFDAMIVIDQARESILMRELEHTVIIPAKEVLECDPKVFQLFLDEWDERAQTRYGKPKRSQSDGWWWCTQRIQVYS